MLYRNKGWYRYMKKTEFNKYLRDCFKLVSVTRKAKSTICGVYKKERDYFWSLYHTSGSGGRNVAILIKPWKFDELLLNITHPGEDIRFTDIRRFDGFCAMSSYTVKEMFFEYPLLAGTEREIDYNKIPEWCESVFEQSLNVLDKFIDVVEADYGSLEKYHIAHAGTDLLNAAFSYVALEDYDNAEILLLKATEQGIGYNFVYGNSFRDLRDVLIDYCRAKKNGKTWTRDMVLKQ